MPTAEPRWTAGPDFEAAIVRWRADAELFARECLGMVPDRWQSQGFAAYNDPNRPLIAFQACAGPGKTCELAVLGWHHMLTRARVGHHPIGNVLSVTGDNLRANLWRELGIWLGRAPVLQRLFEQTADRCRALDHPQSWFLQARGFAKTASADEQGRTLSGTHGRFVLTLVDEAGDIAPAVIRTAEQSLTGCEWGKIVIAGNPTSHGGALYEASQSGRWTIIRITADPDDPDRSPRVDIEWAREQIAKYGRADPWVKAYILGQFPPQSINALLGPDEVRDALGRQLRDDQYDWSQKRLGVDVARFGDDKTVIFPRQGLASFMPVEMRGARANEIAARVLMAKDKWGSEVEFIDDTGTWGAGVVDQLITSGHAPMGISFAAPALDPRYKNRRVEMWLNMAAWIKRGGALPPVPEIVAELTTPTYTYDNGKFVLEDKAQIKARLKRSPDLADALALTFAIPDQPSGANTGLYIGGAGQSANIGEYDPFADGR